MKATSKTYLWHLTLDTGHGRRSYRDEVEDSALTLIGQDLAEALTLGRCGIRDGYDLRVSAQGAAMMATIESHVLGPLATIAVSANSRSSAGLWGVLKAPTASGAVAVGDAPRPPWCAVRLYPAVNLDLPALEWLGDYERLLAWAWIERPNP